MAEFSMTQLKSLCSDLILLTKNTKTRTDLKYEILFFLHKISHAMTHAPIEIVICFPKLVWKSEESNIVNTSIGS
jgi:hypothetical protein